MLARITPEIQVPRELDLQLLHLKRYRNDAQAVTLNLLVAPNMHGDQEFIVNILSRFRDDKVGKLCTTD